MCIDLEEDAERDFFTWEKIEGSEDYLLLEKMGCNYEKDNYETGEYAGIIKTLQKVSPKIRWRFSFDGSDSYGASPSQWRIICVPDDQISEAEYIFNRFLNDDDLENYSDIDKYPEIYDNLPDRQSELNENIIKIHRLFREYENLLFREKFNIDVILEKLTLILPQMYSYAILLPQIPHAHDLAYEGTMSYRSEDINLSPFDEFYFIPEPYDNDKKPKTIPLSELLLSIFEDIEQGLIAFSEDEPDLIAAAVNDWKMGFSREHGWGRDTLIALFAVHQAKRKIRNQRRYGR